MEKVKQKFMPPAIIRELSMFPEEPVLASSIVDTDITVKSMGQEVENHDFSKETFNHEWE